MYDVIQEFKFDLVGEYNITIRVYDEAGNSASDFFMVTVNDITPPDPVLDVLVIIDQNTIHTFDPSTSSDNVGIINYSWSFTYNGNEIDLFGDHPTFLFDIPGEYSITLILKDDAHNTGSTTQMIKVIDTEKPVANITYIQEDPYPGVVEFMGTGSTDNVGIVSFNWTVTLDPEVILSGESINYEFLEPGIYQIELHVSDAEGNFGTQFLQVVIIEEPIEPSDDDDITDDDEEPVDDDIDDDSEPVDDDVADDDDVQVVDDDDNGSSIGTVILIVIIVIFILVGMAALVGVLLYKKREDNSPEIDTENGTEIQEEPN